MMKHSIFRILSLVFLLLGTASFASDDDILMIEIAGTANGTVEIELLPDVAPLHVERIKKLARDGAYDGIVFHRVMEGFMAQTGDVKHGKQEGFNLRYAGSGGSSFPNLKQEFSDESFLRGVVGMARSSAVDSANSQFFIMFAPGTFLDGKYTVFGRVTSGMDIVDQIQRGDLNANGAVEKPDVMTRVWIKSDG